MKSFVLAYIGNICVFNQTGEDHIFQVSQVLDQLQGARMTVKAGKYRVVSYLGHKTGNCCLKPELAKVEAIRDWLVAQNKKQVQAFMGMAGNHWGFVPHFSSMACVGQISKTSWSQLSRARGLSGHWMPWSGPQCW